MNPEADPLLHARSGCSSPGCLEMLSAPARIGISPSRTQAFWSGSGHGVKPLEDPTKVRSDRDWRGGAADVYCPVRAAGKAGKSVGPAPLYGEGNVHHLLSVGEVQHHHDVLHAARHLCPAVVDHELAFDVHADTDGVE